jgi:hypothetical protein
MSDSQNEKIILSLFACGEAGRPGENPHNYQDSIRVEEPPQQKQKASQTTINKTPQPKPPQRTQYKCVLNPKTPTIKPPTKKPYKPQ